ncbi:hypothetical protein WH47_10461 [Habropoda laboriosa]|uniref:Uncharacterized protein n=1 Tax=Habropoda laboriosa TaxID=597456 RepID=A0A0L7QMH7_9HYME|nr:hypothetical protein WH47_10461 [Habropoda laboriosa]
MNFQDIREKNTKRRERINTKYTTMLLCKTIQNFWWNRRVFLFFSFFFRCEVKFGIT